MYTKENLFSGQSRVNSFQLSKLHTFEVAARHGSFSLAAEELSLTPSAISHRINKLEVDIGIQLFKRTHRKITLTEEGVRIYQSLQKALNELNQEIFDVKSGDVSGPLTVYSRPSFAQCWLVPRIHDFNQRYPDIELRLLTGNENVDFQGYGIDVAIYFDEHRPKKLHCETLFQETIIPVCSSEYAARFDLHGSIHNLANTTLLHDNQAWDYDSNDDEWQGWAKANGIKSLLSQSSIGFDRSDLAVVAATNHAGIAMGRCSLVQNQLLSGELITPFTGTEVPCKQSYYAATLPTRRSEKVTLFIEWLKSQT
ncbi:DNA-binding transcriptional regulator DsdC [Vibrio sp. SCSIO 43135]|uniref:DNA-binding transcriptional regulator DsdC n=1 Tax=Vibrio sp. SCSIO 43135 TaxID=2819096 RepID=UPI00207606D7|nr:DNA-binding transcriptional regulator DsdC [Vibrio sp. SCSIO 43135]USD42989.1 DNA-binding transcriptional regulator DsdC [Vibrio sp. SCSIO 43135]